MNSRVYTVERKRSHLEQSRPKTGQQREDGENKFSWVIRGVWVSVGVVGLLVIVAAVMLAYIRSGKKDEPPVTRNELNTTDVKSQQESEVKQPESVNNPEGNQNSLALAPQNQSGGNRTASAPPRATPRKSTNNTQQKSSAEKQDSRVEALKKLHQKPPSQALEELHKP